MLKSMQQDIQNHRDSDLISRLIRDKQSGLDKKKSFHSATKN